MLNQVILIGNLGKDPELRSTPGGQDVCNFSIATTERFKDRDGNQQDRTEWHSIVVWGKLAGLCGQYLAKGRQVCVIGKLQTRKWQDKSGTDRYTTEIVAHDVRFLGAKGGDGARDRDGRRSDPPDQRRPPNDDEIPF